MKKLNIAVIFGGTNTEHEVSLVSARSIIQNLDPQRYQVLPVMITKANAWITPRSFLANHREVQSLPASFTQSLTVKPQDITALHKIDVYFPAIHGPFGEDGTLQGLLELMHVPYVGCGVLGSSVCMDKDVQKRLCREAGIPVVPYQTLRAGDPPPKTTFPCFIKPANQGSSIGVTKAHHQAEFDQAIKLAFTLDTKIIIETAVDRPREIECALLGTTTAPKASLLGEIIASNEFYDYDAKYVDGQSQAIIPTPLNPKLTLAIQTAAKKAFSVTECYGLARVDFLVDRAGEYYLNELNTMPGFTTISMYPKLWQASGLSYPQLIDRLIDLALKRYDEKAGLNFSYTPKKTWYT